MMPRTPPASRASHPAASHPAASRLPSPALLALALALVFGPGSAQDVQAQVGIAVEPRVGVTFPGGDLSDAGAEAGLTLGAELLIGLQQNLEGYAGFSHHAFACDEGCGIPSNPRNSGPVAGLKYTLPSPPDARLWLRGGVTGYRYADDQATAGRTLGFEGSGGIDLIIRDMVYLTPHVGITRNEALHGLTALYLVFGIGLQYRLR